MSFSFSSLIPGVGPEYAHVATAGIVTAGLVAASFAGKKALGTGEKAATPADKFSLRAVFEMVTEAITNLSDTVVGHDGRKYVPMFAGIFFFILINNLVGILPGMTPATENMNTAFAVGVFVFVTYNVYGLKENGLAYLKHFLGPVIWLAFLMLPLELISHMVRPFSLGLRLSNVMMGDHTVVGAFTELAPILVPIPFYVMGLIVSLIQALVFTLLAMVYIGMAVAHEEH